jgi:hypothetical protein
MPIKLNLNDESSLTRHTLIHGGPNSGKTFLTGSAMQYFSLNGKTVKYINLKGEGGYRTLSAFNLPEDCADMAESLKDIIEIVKSYGKFTDITCIDSIKYLWTMAIDQVCGKGKLPTVGGNSNDWGKIHQAATSTLDLLIESTRQLIALCPSDRSMDQLKGSTFVTPDLPGRMAAGIAGKFDLVGYIESNSVGSKVRRVLHFEPMTETITRIRGKEGFTKPIVLDEGLNVWEQIEKELSEKL